MIGWIFLLRIKSESIPMRRKPPTENMSEYGRAGSHSVLGMVGRRLALKLRRRRHMASGSILKRPLCCERHDPASEDLHIPQLLCPVRPIWPAVRDRMVAGQPIFPALQSRNLFRHRRERGASLNWPAANKLGTQSFRRGVARALISAGGAYARLLRPGQWRGNAVKFYLDLGEDERRAMTDIFFEGSGDEPS